MKEASAATPKEGASLDLCASALDPPIVLDCARLAEIEGAEVGLKRQATQIETNCLPVLNRSAMTRPWKSSAVKPKAVGSNSAVRRVCENLSVVTMQFG